ncbi:acetyltransferase [Loktanella sp. 5RATIMAR09]|nr:acetyltransferase [Loktanella sp. 5RATIMAR09]
MHEENGSKGRYYIVHGSGESELTYSVVSEKQVIADHTEVASGHEGEGVGLMLLREFVADARSKGFQILPLCPFVNAQRRKHPEWSDVFSV